MSEDIVKKRGRPPKDGAKRNPFPIKLSDEELYELSYYSEQFGKSKAELMREAFRSYKNLLAMRIKNDDEDDEY